MQPIYTVIKNNNNPETDTLETFLHQFAYQTGGDNYLRFFIVILMFSLAPEAQSFYKNTNTSQPIICTESPSIPELIESVAEQ